MLETSKMSEVVFCGTIGEIASGHALSEITKQSIALAHLLFLRAKDYGLDSVFTPDDYKTKLADLMVDYTEMLIQYENAYTGVMVNGGSGLSDVFKKLSNVKKAKFKSKIDACTKDQASFTCRSWGNTVVVRACIVALVARSLDELHFMIEEVAKCTHNQVDAVKACKAAGDVVFLSRLGWDIDAIKSWINCKYKVDPEFACSAYDMDKSCNDVKESYKNKADGFRLQAKNTVPAAVISVFNADSFEKALENAKSIGGDRHVICSITSALAAAFWPIPEKYIKDVKNDLSKKKAKSEINIHVGQNYAEKVKADINPEEISKQFNQCYGKLQRDTAPLEWQLKNTELALESLKTDLDNSDEKKKEDIFKLLDSVAKHFSLRTQFVLPSDKNWKLKNELLGKIKTLLEQYFPGKNTQQKELIKILESAIVNDTNYNSMAAPNVAAPIVNVSVTKTKKTNLTEPENVQGQKEIKEITEIADDGKKNNEEDNPKGNDLEIATVTDLSAEIPDNQGLWSVCDFVKFGIFALTSIATIIFAINKLWLLLGVNVFVGLALFGIYQFIQNKICSKKSNLNNLSKNTSKPGAVVVPEVVTQNMGKTIPATEPKGQENAKTKTE